MAKYLTVNANGIMAEVEAQETSVGPTDADKIPTLNSDGHIDKSMIPSGVEVINVDGAYGLPIATKSKWELTLLSDTTLSFDMTDVPTVNSSSEITIVLKQDSTGGRTPTFHDTILWSDGAVPTWTTTPGGTDVIDAFTLNNGVTWYATLKGLSYFSILTGMVMSLATSDVLAVGSYVKKASDYESAGAIVQAIASVERTGIVNMSADMSVVSVGSTLYAGVADITGTASVTASSGLIHDGASSVAANATITPAGSRFVGGAVDATATSTFAGDAEVYLFVEGAAPMAATATADIIGGVTQSASTAMAASATVSAVGVSGVTLAVTLTDSVNLGTTGAPYNATWDEEGMTTSVIGGVPPYLYTITVNQWRYVGGSWTSGCDIHFETDNKIDVNDITTAITNATSCGASDDGTTSVALDLTTSKVTVGTGQDDFEFDVTLKVTDSVADEATADALARFILVY